MNDSIKKLLKERYLLSYEKSWEDIAKRVSKIYPKSYEIIKNLIFIPSSPTLMNANTNGERKGTLSSCFPMYIEDSIEGIMDAAKEASLVTKNGGGIGYNFSSLRSSNEMVKTLNRSSSGPLPFINIFNTILDSIQQGGVRRGAGMAMLNINHPNILDFIEAKKNYKENRFARFNFSVAINNEFYKKLEKEPDSIMIATEPSSGKNIELQDSNGNKISVKELWNKIIKHAWQSAEPGIFNYDIAYNQCTTTNVKQEVLPNPCIAGDSIIKTNFGDEQIKDIVGKQRKVWSFNINKNIFELRDTNKIWKTRENSEIYQLELEDGKILKLTSDHKVYTKRGFIEASTLTDNDEVLIF